MRQERRGLSWPKIIGLTLLILISVYAFLPTISGPGVSSELSRNMKSAKDILTVSRIYAESHQGKFPETVIDASAQIWGHANPDKSKYYEIRTKRLEDWLYYPGAELDSPGTRIVLAAPRELPSKNGSERRRIVWSRRMSFSTRSGRKAQRKCQRMVAISEVGRAGEGAVVSQVRRESGLA